MFILNYINTINYELVKTETYENEFFGAKSKS